MRPATMLLLLVLVPDAAHCAQANSAEAPQSAQQLIKDVIYNELRDRERDSFWKYRSHAISAKKDILREQVETADGPVYRVLASHGQEFEGAQAAKEERRLAGYVHDPAEVAKVRRSHESDEARLAHVMQLIPSAYTFEYEGATTGDQVRLRFQPNPAFAPASYEDRILCGLGGEMVVDQRQKRMISMDGTIQRRIEFGYGLLGAVEPGGTFEIHRTQVSTKHWKTDRVSVHVQGKIFLFSDISKNQEETRWGFSAVPQDISLEQARETLDAAAVSCLASAERASR
jgi:hypothetical protein